MSQSTIEAGIISTITQHADFNNDNTVLYDRRKIGKGLARLVLVTYSQVRREPLTIKIDRRIWTYNIDVLVPWRGELPELDVRIGTETQKVIDTLAKYPRLNGTAGVIRTDMTLSAVPDIIQVRKTSYRGRRHALDIIETFDPERAE